MRLTIDELLILAPRLRTYLTTPNPVWRDVVDAADWLRGEMGISRSLWGEACLAMGRECAAVAVALVSARRRSTSAHPRAGISTAWWPRPASSTWRAQPGAHHLGAAAGEGHQGGGGAAHAMGMGGT